MIVYEDIVSGDQVLSDSRPFIPFKIKIGGEVVEIPNIFMVQSKMVTKGPVEVNTGANASAEGGEEGADDQAVKVVDLIDPDAGFGYEGPQSYSEKDFQTLFKTWCKAVKDKIEEKGGKPKDFMQSAKAFHPAIKDNFSSFEVYHTKSFCSESFVLGYWDDEANELGAPKFIYFTNALNKIKY